MAKLRTRSDSDTKNIFEKGILSRNPVLVYAIGICPLIAVAKSAATASILAILSAILLIVLEVLTALILKKLPKWLRVGVYALLGVLIIIPFYMLMGVYMPSIEVSLGIYIPLLAVNSITVQRCEAFAVKHSVRYSFLDAAANSIGYAIPLILTGIIREALGSSRIFGYYIDALPQADGFLMPFCGFIILGFVAAFINYIRNKFRIGEEFDTKGNDFVIGKKKDAEIDEEDEDSIQNEITIVPEAVSESFDSTDAIEQEKTETSEPESSESDKQEAAYADFESSVDRIMHKWSSKNDSETSAEIGAEKDAGSSSDKPASETLPEKAETEVKVAWEIVKPAASSDAAPVKSEAAEAAVIAVAADTDTEKTEAESAAEAVEAPAPKKTTRKRTTKKAAEAVADEADTAATTTAADTAEAETPSPKKKTTRKSTAKKATETMADAADTVAVATASGTPEANAEVPKKTTRKSTAKKTTKTQGADDEAAVTEEAPKKTTRKRTTSEAAEKAEPVLNAALKED